ncbi:MAG: hypothetical protein AAGM46_26865, partial [Cyanobacteria bacterium J06582_2]
MTNTVPSHSQGNFPYQFPLYSTQPYASPYTYSPSHLPQQMPTYPNPTAQPTPAPAQMTTPNLAQMGNPAQMSNNLAQMGNNLAQMSISQKKPPKPPKLDIPIFKGNL